MFLISTVKIKKTPKKGRGVFATANIKAGRVIGDYIGKIIRPEEENEKEQGLYVMWGNDEMSILGNPKERGIHLINHSCMPNCGMYIVKGHTIFFALRKIHKGEEFTISYCLEPKDKECDPCAHKCGCETMFCKGTMHETKKAERAYSAYLQKLKNKNKNNIEHAKYNEKLKPLVSYPKFIPDQPIHPVFGNTEKQRLNLKSKKPSLKNMREQIRKTGRTLYLPRQKTEIIGIKNGQIIKRKTV